MLPHWHQTAGVRERRDRPRRGGFLDVLDAIETLAYGLGALALLVFLLFLGIRAAHRLAGPAASGTAVAAALTAVVVVARDAPRRRWSPVSVGAACAYGLCLVALIVAEFFVA